MIYSYITYDSLITLAISHMIFVTTRSFTSIIHMRSCSDLCWLGKCWIEYTKSFSSTKLTINWKTLKLYFNRGIVIRYRQQCPIEKSKFWYARDVKYISLVCLNLVELCMSHSEMLHYQHILDKKQESKQRYLYRPKAALPILCLRLEFTE